MLVVVDEVEIPNDIVSVGSIVKVKDYEFDEEVEYSIVGSAEADPMNFKISNESPVGSALVGKKVGDIVEVAVPDGVNKFEVLRNKKKLIGGYYMSTEEMNIQELESQFSEQEGLRREKLAELQDEGKDPFDVYKVERTHTSEEVKDNFEELEGKEVTVAGRIMSKRGQGKVVFSDIHDRDGKIQLFLKIDEVGEENLKQYKTFDLGDWVAATGEVFKTKTGEISVKCKYF